jgi:hypothetical protein
VIDGFPADYLAAVSVGQREKLARVNRPGLEALRRYLAAGQAVAFLGAGVSAPLYPLWTGLITELVAAASGQLTEEQAATCLVLARESPEEVVEFVRRGLGPGRYREVLRDVLRVRTDPETGRSWTPVQELICRCPFKAVVTTNYDPGIVDARMRVRPSASAIGFTTWEDELGLDGWRTGDVFGESELPVLFAHGQHNRPDSVVLATTEYRRAYAGKLPHVLGGLVQTSHLAWIGFSFADQRIAAILHEIADRTRIRIDPARPPRHVAVMAWDPAATAYDPGVLAQRVEIAYGARLVLYPAPSGDQLALAALLEAFTDPRFPPAVDQVSIGGVQAGRVASAPGQGSPTAPSLATEAGAENIIAFPLHARTPRSLKSQGRAVFISYSHRDRRWVDRLLIHLKPLQRENLLDIWDDSRIRPGTKWRDEIEEALNKAAAAILVISPNFLASDFVMNDEVPTLLQQAESRGTVIIPLIVAPSLFGQSMLSRFQAVNPPEVPLSKLNSYKRDEILVKVATSISALLI